MNSQKIENNIENFEKRISNAFIVLLVFAFVITTILFSVISYQSYLQQNSKKSKDIETTINLFQYNLSEKLSIIASSNIFMDFFTSGNSTRSELEPKFSIELLPLRSSGIIGYSLINSESGTTYQSGEKSEQSLTVKLCYLANRLDSENGNCRGNLKLFFSSNKILKELIRINGSIKECATCNKYSLTKNSFFGNFPVEGQSKFYVTITTNSKHDNIVYYYIIIIFILFIFSLFNRAKLRNIIKETIFNPIDLLVQKIKSQESLTNNPKALYEINYLSSQIEAGRLKINKINEYEKQAAIGYLAASVAHDIRSPLAVMEIATSSISNIIPSAELTTLNQAVQSVRDIANNLLDQHRTMHSKEDVKVLTENGNTARPVLLSPLIKFITAQKKHEWRINPCNIDLIINTKTKFVWVYAAPNDIKRTLSNLLNNAYEALLDTRNISISLDFFDSKILLKIKDSGHGIPKHKIKAVLNGLSLKHPGQGFGLSNAKKYIESIEGSLELSSSPKEGTIVQISLLPHPCPIWHPKTINIHKNSIIIVLDDDASIHNLWRHRLQTLGLSAQHFINSQNLFDWYDEYKIAHQTVVYFIDYELRNESCNGLEVFSKLKARNHAYLITSHADKISIQEKCIELGIWLLDKTILGEIDIKISNVLPSHHSI